MFVLIVAVVVLVRRDGEVAFPRERDPRRWPFAASSIWNMPLGTQARLVPAGLVLPEAYGAEENVLVLQPDAPLRPVYRGRGFGPSNAARCEHGGEVLYELPIPERFTTVGPGGLADEGTPNAASAVLSVDGRTLIQSQPLAVCGDSGPVTTVFEKTTVDLFGEGIEGAHGGSALSSIGGTLRLGELTRDNPHVRHALKITVDAEKNLSFAAGGFRWPALQADSYASPDRYGGNNPELRMGALLALPPSATLDLQSEPGRILARTLRDYGAYVVDDAAQPAINIAVEHSPEGRFIDQFAGEWGFTFAAGIAGTGSRSAGSGSATTNRKAAAWKADLDQLFGALVVVTDNGPRSVGGAGTRRACFAPPFADGPDVAAGPTGCP